MMTSLKRWHLLPLAAFLFMSINPTLTEVVNSTSHCNEFLLDGTPPHIPGILEDGNIVNRERYKPICQTYKDQRRFVTLYDTENKIPVFSAYKYRREQNIEKTRRPSPWQIEPQENKIPVFSAYKYSGVQIHGLRPDTWMTEIQLEERNTNNMWDGTYCNQAIEKDYINNNRGYNKGHLFPNSHAFDINEKTSTFTLTNIVPQAESFNNGSWKKMETCTKCILEKYCINSNGANEAFLVTGAQPSKDNKLKNRVNIPSMLWSAFCCYSKNKNKWLASAHWGDNVEENKTEYLQTKTLAELQQNLSTVNSRFEVFPGTECPLDTTVAEFYSKIGKKCECPPQASTTSAPPTTTTSVTTTTASPSSTTVPTTTTTTTTKKTDNNSENDDGEGGKVGRGGEGGITGVISVIAGAIGSLISGIVGAVAGGPTISSGPQTTSNQTSMAFILATSEPQTYTSDQTSMAFIPETSEPQTDGSDQTSMAFIPETSEPQTDGSDQTSMAFIPETSEPQKTPTRHQ